ncbi:response regulator [Paraburkholderia fungorum]|uniref:SAV_2336 N-terminal domain-related protein n=1 Tax=Paraburkholderia fungorum TaxID=134537 RepID=UPI0038BDF4A9
MSLQRFLARLEAANFDADVEQLLDAFWLATQGVKLSLDAVAPARKHARADEPASARAPADAGETPSQRPDQRPASGENSPVPEIVGDSGLRLVFPRITSDESAALERPASPVILPAPRSLTNRLALMRALRPLTRRWPSRQYLDLDEDGTVDACARLWMHESDLVMPVFKPRRERWFDVELVLEDDGAAPLWEDMLREFAALLRETGAFGRVREWTLRVEGDEGMRAATLENRHGVRAPVASLQGKAARRLILFASNGASRHWTDGAYAKVLVPWLSDSCTLLLQLTPTERWARSGLGEPHGVVSTTVAGALPPALDMHLDRWRIEDDEDDVDATRAGETVALPVAPFSAVGLAQWADMQMARGRRNAAYRLRMPKKSRAAPPAWISSERRDDPTDAAVAQALSLLKYESPSAFRLAVFLCTSPFTLPVARLVQAVKFDSADPGLLDELLRSGVLVASQPGAAADDRDRSSRWYSVRPQARELLLRSLREREAQEIARELQRHVSRHIERLSGSGSSVRSTQLIADDEGRFHLPAWAQPFADVATSLLGLPSSQHEAQRQVRDFLERVESRAALIVADIAASGRRPSAETMPESAWEALCAARLVHQRGDGSWAFAPYARDLLASITPRTPRDDVADWLEMALDMLQAMALAFHVSAITAVNGERNSSVRDLLSEWSGERRAQLAHWLYMSEYIFWGPTRELLFTGEDPIRHFDVAKARANYERDLTDAENWLAGTDDEPWRWHRAVERLRNAAGLALKHDPQGFEKATLSATLRLLRDFAATPIDDVLADHYGRDERFIILRALRERAQRESLSVYYSPFFERFGTDGMSELAFSTDYTIYLDRLMSLWKDAVVTIFERLTPVAPDVLTVDFPVSLQAVERVARRFPAYGIHMDSSGTDVDMDAGRQVRWSISRTGYVALIDELGQIVSTAVATRLSRPPRRPRVLWVDDRPDNNANERNYGLAQGQLIYELATTTDEGLAKAREALFDVVISDMGRPGDSSAGYTLLKALRRQDNYVPFVIFAIGRKPEHVAAALRAGAIGTTDHHGELAALVLRAVGLQDETLRRPIDEKLLLQYTVWKFPGMETAEEWNREALRDLYRSRFATLLDVDDAVDRAWEAVDAYARERPDLFRTGTDRLTKSLGFVSALFRRRHSFERATLDAFTRHAHLVRPKRSRD